MRWIRRTSLASGVIACTVGIGAASSAGVVEHVAGPHPGGEVIARIGIPANSGVLAVGSGAVWVSSDAVSLLLRIDPSRNSVVARTRIAPHNPCPELPGSCGAAATGGNALWISRTPDNTV